MLEGGGSIQRHLTLGKIYVMKRSIRLDRQLDLRERHVDGVTELWQDQLLLDLQLVPRHHRELRTRQAAQAVDLH